ncbi:MAG: monovalent cation/H(+) antiporter subunit G [Pseudomonadota bacterium]
MIEITAGIIILLGGFFAVIAAVGVVKLPDVLTRMHASTKAGTLAGTLMLIAAAVVFQETSVTVRVIIAILFLFITAPIAAHMIGRAAVKDAEDDVPVD